jgi:HEAT repeat protein/beta-lactamase regulating signal transducer with metallopeptidase domain
MNLSDFPSAWLPLVDSVLKATVVLLAAFVATSALRHASAALRHLIWTLALVGALMMPVLSLALPRWELPLFTIASTELPALSPVAPPIESDATPNAPAWHRSPASSAVNAPASPNETGPARVSRLSWPTVLFALWAIGVLFVVGRVIVGIVAVQWMARHGQRVLDAPWMKMAVGLASEVGVSSNITFLRSRRATMPMACGVLRPAVMMPAEADAWPVDRLRIVLLHELAHVKRHDCLTHLVAQVACAFHWFNPLAWIAARQVRTERERACDDLVLAAGTQGPDYADQLLEIARAMRAEKYPAVLAGASLAMAHRSQLEGRLMAILDPRVPHAALTRLRATAATMVCCAAVIPVAALQPWTDDSAKAPVALVSPVSPAPHVDAQTPTPAPTPTAAPTPLPRPAPDAALAAADAADATAAAIADATREGTKHGVLNGTLQGTVHGVLGSLMGATDAAQHAARANGHDHQETDTDDEQESKPTASKADPRMVEALTAALKDSDKDVRETAMHALVQMRDPSIFDPLVLALKDSSPDVREQAAFGLGQLRDRRAVEPLVAALKDDHADVREQAAFALGQLRDRAAIPGLSAALKDVAPDVREQAIFALGQFRDPATLEGLSLGLRDANGDVREQAAFALGQLRDRRAMEPLISALKDSDADVREQAAFALGQLRDRGAVEALVIALKDSAADVREQAAFALGQIRDPRAIDGLTTALKDPQAAVRQQAAFALGQLAR